MIETQFLVPERTNDGERFSPSAWKEIEERLLLLGGFSWNPGVRGVWQSSSGRVYRDRSRQYLVSLASWTQLPAWLEVVLWARRRFRQEALYIKVAGIPEILEG